MDAEGVQQHTQEMEEDLVKAVTEQVGIDDQTNTSSNRAKKQKAKLRKQMVREATHAAAQLEPTPTPVHARDVPPIVHELREAHGRHVRWHVDQLGVGEEEGAQFVQAVTLMGKVGAARSRNKKLLALSNRITARLDVAADNSLFKLATCRVTVQPHPTPGWDWIMGTLGDDEFHAFRRQTPHRDVLDMANPPAGVALNLCYEPGKAGDREHIFGYAVLSKANALGTRFEVLKWNQRLGLLDALIVKIAALEPKPPGGGLELSLALDVSHASPGLPTLSPSPHPLPIRSPAPALSPPPTIRRSTC
jgi:hypothetical protein